MRLRLLEAEGFDEEEVIDDEEIVDDEEVVNDEESANTLGNKKISFPVIFEGFDEDQTPISIPRQSKEQIANQYADNSIRLIEENKKFILSALDTYDLECYYENIDLNSFVHFIVDVADDIQTDLLWNVLKRYFSESINEVEIDEGIVSISPVLDNKYVKII